MSTTELNIVKDIPSKKVTIIREFDAPLTDVWRAWTESELLDLWWAPTPWRAETKSMNFTEGGRWLYSMVGPKNERHWSLAEYEKIVKHQYYIATDGFCDEDGNVNRALPYMKWTNEFSENAGKTIVTITVNFSTEEQLKQLVEMGFEAGFNAALKNLDQYFKIKLQLHKENKTSSKARTSSYLNFPGNTEEAFNFYKSVFGGEFSGKGLQRFADIPSEPGNPPVPEEIKNMILHVELEIVGGHIIMATDAPKEMGFDLKQGNNMHICLEPETRVETKRLFDALSEGGKITMPLEDMFFGAYFGECSDKYGINWMFNCTE